MVLPLPPPPISRYVITQIDLAPGRPYPRQLQQAALVLNHVLDKLHYSPQNIVLTGDSAGANLVLSFLSHINHPHPSTTLSIPPIKLEGEFKGAVLISPWVDFDNSKDSYKRNKYKDCLNETALKQWSVSLSSLPSPPHPLSPLPNPKPPRINPNPFSNPLQTAFLLSTPESDNYSQPILAPPSWWSGLSISSILIVSGSDEVLIDGITEFEKKLSEGFGKDKVEFQVVKGEYHDQPSLDIQFGYTKPEDEGKQARIIKEWISSTL
jgi:acetyl esterase/lipase